jgi:predicted DCC family thiol-disulfide oxidoreductase YuxK
MKTLTGYTLLYDAECPLCSGYTNAFVKTGMLDGKGRVPYQQLDPAWQPFVDTRRAVNEIALLNRQTGEVTYGVNSLVQVLQHSIPLFRILSRTPGFYWMATRAYRLISYNRRLIIPASHERSGSCPPAFHAGYRALFILLGCFFTAFILNRYSLLLQPYLEAGSFGRELLVCAGQLAWQGGIVFLLLRRRVADYLGNLITISIAGAVLLAVLLLVDTVVKVSALVALGWFGLVVTLMLLEHVRRVKLLRLTGWESVSWVVYRILVLLILL